MPVLFSKDFFDLQLCFAERIRAISGLALADTLLEYTNLYVRFSLGREFDARHPGWQAFTSGLRDAADARNWTYEFYMRNAEANTMPSVVATFGCFSYAHPHGTIRLHFRPAAASGCSPLAAADAPQRRAELTEIFRHARATVPHDTQVLGQSWLYNLQAYRRLFPESYARSATPMDPPSFQSMHLWGQFVDREGRLKGDIAQSFLAALERVSKRQDLVDCFPLRPLRAAAPLVDFLRFYGL